MKFVRKIVLPRTPTEPNRDMAHQCIPARLSSIVCSARVVRPSTAGELQELRNSNGGVSVGKHSPSSISMTMFVSVLWVRNSHARRASMSTLPQHEEASCPWTHGCDLSAAVAFALLAWLCVPALPHFCLKTFLLTRQRCTPSDSTAFVRRFCRLLWRQRREARWRHETGWHWRHTIW